MKDLLRTTADRAARYLASLKERSVAPTPEALANLARLDEPLPERPAHPAAVIALLDEVGSPATMGSAGGRFFGFVVGGSLPAAGAAWLECRDQRVIRRAADQRRGGRRSTRERPQGAHPGRHGTRARDPRAGGRPGQDARRRAATAGRQYAALPAGGQREHRRLRSRRRDHSASQGGGRVGARGRRVRTVGRGRAGPRAPGAGLRRRGLMGDRCAQVAQCAVRQRHRHRARPRDLYAAMAVNAPYLVIGDAREPEHYTPEFSRRARGIEVWAALRSLGRTGLADLIERTCRHATRFAEGLREAGFEILNDVVINQVLVSFGDPELTRRVIAGVQADGTCWAGGTVWQG